MIYVCPFCGVRVSRVIKDGITTCNHCHRIFDSSSFNKILSAAWSARQDQISDPESLQSVYDLSKLEAAIIKKYEDYSHDDLFKILNSNKSNLEKCLD